MVNNYNDPGCRRTDTISLAGFLARSSVNGPGIRAVVWVQGCPHRCRGCFNEAFQPFSSAPSVPVDDLAQRILAISGIDGVTFTGGEPFAHAAPLAVLGERLRPAGLSIVTYSGYTAGELATGTDPAWPALLAVTDLLVAGPFIAARARPHPLIGSENQQIISLGCRPDLSWPGARTDPDCRTEFCIAPDGNITAPGFPERSHIDRIRARCRGA
jgi:anaerobic ribonucleoside-triphosphate reductase activating protein